MVTVQVCVGSSCHLKGSEEIVGLLEKSVKDNNLEDKIALVGCFCAGRCNRIGVTVIVNDAVYAGITVDNFSEFWTDKIMGAVKAAEGE